MIERTVAVVALLLMASCGAILGNWYFIEGRTPPLTITGSETDKTVYRPGEMMRVTRNLCWNSDATYVLHRAFIDHLVYTLPDYGVTPPTVGCTSASVLIPIPEALPAGDYTYRVFGDFHINPIKTVRIVFPDIKISVVIPQ